MCKSYEVLLSPLLILSNTVIVFHPFCHLFLACHHILDEMLGRIEVHAVVIIFVVFINKMTTLSFYGADAIF